MTSGPDYDILDDFYGIPWDTLVYHGHLGKFTCPSRILLPVLRDELLHPGLEVWLPSEVWWIEIDLETTTDFDRREPTAEVTI